MGAAASLAGVLNAFLQRSSHGDGGRQLQEWQQCCSIGAAALRSIACTGSTRDRVAACVQPQRYVLPLPLVAKCVVKDVACVLS